MTLLLRHLTIIEIVLGTLILAGAVYLTHTGTRIPPIAVSTTSFTSATVRPWRAAFSRSTTMST